MITGNLYKILSLILFGLCIALPARSDQTHQRNILPGLRAAQMGGAYTALSDDASGAFYNPSGIVFGHDQEFSLSANSYKTSLTEYQEAVSGESVAQNSTSFYPGFIGAAKRFGPLAFGYSYFSLDSAGVDQTNVFTDLNLNSASVSYLKRTVIENRSWIFAGASASLKIGSYLSVGTSEFYTRRSNQSAIHQLLRYSDSGYIATDLKYDTLNEGMSNVSGVMLRFSSFSLGASVRTSHSISDRTNVSSDVVSYLPSTSSAKAVPTITTSEYKTDAFNELNPTTYSLGIAWQPSRSFCTSADVLFHEGVNQASDSDTGSDLEQTFNFSVGQEILFGPFGIRAGYFTNNALTPKIDSTKVNQREHIDYRGYSLGLILLSKLGETSIGYAQQEGRGSAQVLQESSSVQSAHGFTRTYSFGGALKF